MNEKEGERGVHEENYKRERCVREKNIKVCVGENMNGSGKGRRCKEEKGRERQ